MTVIVTLPQRFQAVNGVSPFAAGIHLLPVLVVSPISGAVAGQLASKKGVPPFYILLTGTTLQLLGVGLSSSVGRHGDKEMYGFEVIMGMGFGLTLITLLMFVPFVVKKADMGKILHQFSSHKSLLADIV